MFARLLWWEVWNFMSIEHGKCEFDERNIINLKGYNDSGKSAMINALKVLICNSNPTKQSSFIQDDKDYFRILACFEDGVQILRDKYLNGQSLYEMYKDGKLLYSTKNGNTLTRITEVPEPIATYLGLIMYDSSCLNARACWEKQFGVQSTGAENYKAFNTVLRSEEIARAGEMLNTDKNKLGQDITAVNAELQAHKSMLGRGENLTVDMIEYLKAEDAKLNAELEKDEHLKGVSSVMSELSSISVAPELDIIDDGRLVNLSEILALSGELSEIKVYPELVELDSSRETELNSISKLFNDLSLITITPELESVDLSNISALTGIQTILEQYRGIDRVLSEDEQTLSEYMSELDKLKVQLEEHGVRMVKCPDCGTIFNPETAHVH